MKIIDVDNTRADIRHMFEKWGIDRSETEILWDESKFGIRMPGAIVRYMRGTKWQEISCRVFPTRAQNLRQIFLFLDRMRIAEDNGVAYSGLSGGKEIVTTNNGVSNKEALLDAYDTLGAGPDDPIDLINDIYRKKSMFYHPDKGGDPEKFKRLNQAYETIKVSRGVK
jgi:DnaJ-domain-containing protein 1